ncbi:MAG: transglutaminase-like domain-containing protein [Planctomycetota bacterium]
MARPLAAASSIAGIDSARRSAGEWTAMTALFACGTLAVANLPRTDLPIGWLLAWTMPAIVASFLPNLTHRPWLRAVAALLVQVAAFGLALRYAGTLTRPAILACTILPPLAYVIVRRKEADAALGLFLSFCVLLVGVILGGVNVPLIAGFALAACVALRCEAHLAAVAAARRSDRPRSGALRTMFATGLMIALPCLFTAFAIERTLAWLPSPLSRGDAARPAIVPQNLRRQGLDDSFDLGNGGLLSDLAGEQLVLVRTADGRPVADDLYLRSGFFQVAGLDRWLLGPISPRRIDGGNEVRLATPEPNTPLVWLEVERFAGARNFVFAPPGSCTLRFVPGLEIDARREWLRQVPGAEQTDYSIAYQPRAEAFWRLEERPDQPELLSLPQGLDPRYETLLDQWGASGPPARVAQRIAAGLSERCRYDRIDPTGPYAHAIDNFLFSPTDRRGYCMHFASAAALLLRLRGIPCRIGVGLYGGVADRREPEARVYGSQHAHAWVEIPLATGFAVFDPTPPAERGRRTPTRSDPTEERPDDGSAQRPTHTDFWAGLIAFLTQPWLLLLVLGIAIGVQLWPRAGVPTTRPLLVPHGVKAARRQLVRILRALADAGYLRTRGQTLEQFGGSLAARRRLEPAVASAFVTYQQVRFGGYPFDGARERVLLLGLEAAQRMPVAGAPDADPGQARNAGQT